MVTFKCEFALMDAIYQQQKWKVVGLSITLSIEIEFQNLKEIQVRLAVKEGVDDGIGENFVEWEFVEDGRYDGFGFIEQLLGEDVELLLIRVHHYENIHEVIPSVVFRVIDNIRGQFPGKMTHTCLLLLYLRTNFDKWIVYYLILVPQKLQQTADMLRSEVIEVSQCISGEDQLVDIRGDAVEGPLDLEQSGKVLIESSDVCDLAHFPMDFLHHGGPLLVPCDLLPLQEEVGTLDGLVLALLLLHLLDHPLPVLHHLLLDPLPIVAVVAHPLHQCGVVFVRELLPLLLVEAKQINWQVIFLDLLSQIICFQLFLPILPHEDGIIGYLFDAHFDLFFILHAHFGVEEVFNDLIEVVVLTLLAVELLADLHQLRLVGDVHGLLLLLQLLGGNGAVLEGDLAALDEQLGTASEEASEGGQQLHRWTNQL